MAFYDDLYDDYDLYDDDFHDDHDASLMMTLMMTMMMAVALTRGQLLCHPLPIIGEINRYTGGRSHTMIH